MVRKLSYILGIGVMLSSAPISGFTQESNRDSVERANRVHHTGLKRGYNKAKHKVKKAWEDTKSGVRTAGDSTKAKARRIKHDDEAH